MDIKSIEWAKMGGLVPAIAQDSVSGEVLMLGFMNEEALNLSLKTGFAHYFSRSRDKIWKKGETSGHTQKIDEIYLDCDNDTVLLKVTQKGVACHTGKKTCFFKRLEKDENSQNLATFTSESSEILDETKISSYDILDNLYHTILDRKLNATPENSYVARLFSKGENAILKKVSEEAGEFILACKDLSKSQKYAKFSLEEFGEHIKGDAKFDAIYEASDLVFHLLVALATYSIHPDQILDELVRRNGVSGIDEKKSRKS